MHGPSASVFTKPFPPGVWLFFVDRFFRLFIGIFARGRFLFCLFSAGTELRTVPTRLFQAASPV